MRSSLVFAVLLSISRPFSRFFLSANAVLVNRTIDDADTDIITYIPSDHWQPSNSASCSGCLKPDVQFAVQQTFHYGMHPVPQGDSDDSPRNRSLAKWRRTDADDPNFVDLNVTASMTFTGSTVYVYCMLPVQMRNATILSKTNLTFLLDGRHVGNFTHDPQTDSGSVPGFQYQIPVFSMDDLPYGQHTLQIQPQLGSIVLLDFVQYSTLDTISATSDTVDGIATPTPSGAIGSQMIRGGHSKKNTATFGVAIGSTVGVLALISLGVFISIYRRRRKSAKRTERDKRLEAQEASDRPSCPEMRGPQPFIPRYFPGVVVPLSTPTLPLIPESSSDSGIEALGPSHGLDGPPAPEHTEAPAYSAPPLVLSERMDHSRIPLSILPSSPLLSADESVPPRYQDVGQTQIVSIPVLTQATPPSHVAQSPPSIRESEESPMLTITTSYFSRRLDSTSPGSAAACADSTTIQSNDQHPQ